MPDPIRLGLMPPLTGLVAIYGPEIIWAARIACEEINERGGVLGRCLQLAIEDDGSSPSTAVPAAVRLIDEQGCVAVIGNLLSNSRIAVAEQVTQPRRVPLLNFSFYEGSISGRYFFNFAALPNQQIDQMIPFMAHRYGLKMFFAGSNYEWPRGSIDAAKRVLQRLGGDIVGEEYLPMGCDTAAIDLLLGQVARSGADVFVPYFAGSDQITLLTRFTELGLKRHMAVVMGHYDEMMVSRLPAHIREGFYSSNSYFMSLDTAESRSYQQRLLRQPGVTGIWPDGNGMLTNFGEGTYLCVHAFAAALAAAGTTETEALVDALEKVRITAPQGVVEMDAATHHAHINSYLSRCHADGTFTIVERFGSIAPRIPERYREQAQSTQWHDAQARPAGNAGGTAQVAPPLPKIGAALQILSIADMAILATDEHGVISDANPSACQVFGYPEEALRGMSVNLLLPPHFRHQHAEMLRRFVAGEETTRRMSARGELMGYRKDGSFFPIEASIAKVRFDDEWLLVVSLHDISQRKMAEDELRRRATHDPLTGLPNRALIRERLATALQRSARSGLNVALLFVDLDGFKLINDSHGHDHGDQLLRSVAARLIEQVRPGDTVARLAGDEFVVLCEEVEQPTDMSVMAERINVFLRQPFDCGGLPLSVSASIGIAIGSGSIHDADDLMRFADTAMYAVKGKGRDGWQFFNESLQDLASQRLLITHGLRTAVERGELSPRFQPIVAAESGRMVGAELLLRWHPPSGEISPGEFIPIAELTGSIVPIGAWVFREACRAEVEWRQRWGQNAPYLSLNVSVRQLNEESLADNFAATLRETGADPARLLLEITETSLMADVETNLRVLRRLADLGLRVAVDDFGTGYSSLAQLTRMPVNVLKIDRAFVDGIGKSEVDRTIIRTIIGLGHSLGLKLVAEGVETAAQQCELCAYGCDLIQGYYFHRPLTKAMLVETFERELLEDTPGKASPLYFLIYVSQATRPYTDEDLAELQKGAQQRNRSAGISGCLVYQEGYFMQMLEGKQDTLQALLARIKADTRHLGVRVVIEGPARQRLFADWGMVLRDLTREMSGHDFASWQRRQFSFLELAEDVKVCYTYMTAYARGQRIDG